MRKLLVLLSIFHLGYSAQSQIVRLDTSISTSWTFEAFVKDSIRVVGSTASIAIQSFPSINYIAGTSYSRDHTCLQDESRFFDLEALPNGSYVGAFLHDGSCTPSTIVMLLMDSVGNRVKEYYFEDYLYGIAEIIVTEDDFHLYVQNSLSGEDMETRHLTFDFDGNLVDSNRFVNERHYFGLGDPENGDKMVRYGDSLLVSYWDGHINDNKRGLALYDMDLIGEPRLLMDGTDVFIGGITLDEDTITVSATKRVNGDLIQGLRRISVDGSYNRESASIQVSPRNIMQFNEYIFTVNNSYYDNQPPQLAIYNSDLAEVYTMSAPSGGRMQQLSDSTFMLYGQGYGAKTFIYTVDLDSLRAITPPRIKDSVATNISERLEHHLSIFPNPTSSTLNINFEQAQEATIGIYSLTGALLLQKEVNTQNAQLNTSALPGGVYLLQIATPEQVSTQRVVISR